MLMTYLSSDVCSSDRPLPHPQFENARVRTPLLLTTDAKNPDILRECFGPVVFVVATDSTDHSIDLARRSVQDHGALSLAGYTTNERVANALQDAAEHAGVSLSLNLTGSVFVNQTAAFSEFHGTGANPAANAAPAYRTDEGRVGTEVCS